MTRLVFSDNPLVVSVVAGGAAVTATSGLTVRIYSDSGATTLADITTMAGAVVANSQLTIESSSQLPLFKGPDDSTDTLYVRAVAGGAIGTIYARVDDRLDTASSNLTVIAAAALSPATITGLALWLKADAITGLSDGNAVASWADQSGLGRDATQATSANQPTYQTGEQNALPVVRFDGTNDRLDCDGLAGALSGTDVAMTVFVAGKNSAADAMWFGAGLSSAVADGRSTLQHRMESGDYVFRKVDDAGSAVTLAGGTPDSSFHVSSVVIPGTTGGYRVDGTTVIAADGTSFNNGATTLDIAAVGALHYSGGYANFLNGDLGELLIYTRALSAAERQQVEWYLGRKWGLTVTTTGFDPVAQVAPGGLAASADQRFTAVQPWWDARSFGTNIPAVQKAINTAASAGGGIVRIRGTFSGSATTLILKDGVHLRGDGIGASTLLFSELGSNVNAIQGQTSADSENPPSISDLSVQGPGSSFVVGTAPANMDGVRACSRWRLTNVQTRWFRSGIRVTGNHQQFFSCRSTNNYYNVYFEDMTLPISSGDQHFYNCLVDGAMFANFAFHACGMLSAGSIVGGHAGFAPYVFYREAGTPIGSFLVNTVIDRFSMESVGNGAILDETTGGVGDSIQYCWFRSYGFAWDGAYKIGGRADDYAVDARGIGKSTFEADVYPFVTGDVSTWRITSGGQNTLKQQATPTFANVTTRSGFTWDPPGKVNLPRFLRTGAYYGTLGGTGVAATTLDRLYATPLVVERPTSFDRIGVEVTTAGSAGAVVRLGVYVDDATGGYPGTVLFDAGTIVADGTTGWKEITISQTFGPGLFWLASVSQTAVATLRQCDTPNQIVGSQDGANTAVATVGYQHVGASGALPSFSSSMSVVGSVPKVRLRVA